MKWSTFAVLLVWATTTASAANILLSIPTPAFSHQQFYRTFVAELHRRGHNLTVLTPNPLNDPDLPNYREVDLSRGYKFIKQEFDVTSESGKKMRLAPEILLLPIFKVVDGLCHLYLSDPKLLQLYRSEEEFDLFIFEWGILGCMYPFAKLAGGRSMAIASFEVGATGLFSAGNPTNPAFTPDISLHYSDRMTFPQRLRSTLFFFLSTLMLKVLLWQETAIARHYLGPEVPHLVEFEKGAGVLLDNSHFSVGYPKPININVIPLGGPAFHLNGRNLSALPEDLKTFMDDAPDGVVYFSLGTNVKTSHIPSREEEVLVQAFGRLKQKVLWKWENDNLRVDLKNVKKAKWFPQVDVLAHPNVKVFVTQAGLQSMGEAIEYHVPMIVMPFFADQGHNAKKLESVGAAKYLDFDYITVDSFTDAINEVVYNKTYKENIIKFSNLIKDQPMPPLERAVWWTEYVLRHNGAPHLRSPAANMPWYKYLNLDVIAVVFLAIFLVLYLTYLTLRALLRLIFKRKKPTKKTEKQKKRN